MGQYERLREERDDAKRRQKRKTTPKRQLSAAQVIHEAAIRQRRTAWRYYRDAARAKRHRNLATASLFGVYHFPDWDLGK